MYHRVQAYFAGIKPVWIDGTFYVLLALFGSVELTFNNDDIYKYVNAIVVFWIKNVLAWCLATVTALKMFRSTSYSEHLNEKAVQKALVDGPLTQTVTSTESKTNEVKIEASPVLPSTPPTTDK